MTSSFAKGFRAGLSGIIKHVNGFVNPHDPAFDQYGAAPQRRSSGMVITRKGQNGLPVGAVKTVFNAKELDQHQRASLQRVPYYESPRR